ncbi:hypothetical protein NC653_012011 [Populus alba x Populus x berolinensis]|uniref:Uncharacterized protein n=1 Tax=Populus alba x Populus x berolinensis TaxID=444605 RepID=A0AAD6R404_9ROSI|nr:hypothetical protein NC653_012011 [Populus alba x Populus x berolinensis]
MSSRKQQERQMLESIYSMIALVFILVTCMELCDAATVVDVYRLIQYDISGAQFGSRFATLNHHAGSLHLPPGVDLSRTVVIIPVRELNITLVKEFIAQRKPLGGLLFLLPQMLNFENRDPTSESKYQIHEKKLTKNVLVELERLLIHANIPVLSSLVDLKNLNLLGNPIAENAKITKKVQKFLPNLHIFNARPVDKSARNEISGRADDSSLIPTNELDYHSEKKKDHTRDVNSSKHVTDQRSDHFDNASDDGEKDLRQKRKKTKGKVSKMEEASTDEQDDAVIEKKLKRKKPHEELLKNNDDRTKVEKKLKSKKSRKELSELDIIDNREVSFADLFSVDTVENLKHNSESKTVDKSGINALGGLLTVSAKKKKTKNQGLVSTVPLSPAVEVGMGGPSTWGDE